MQGAGAAGPVGSRNSAWHPWCSHGRPGNHMDLLYVAATIAFFAVSLAYVRGCDRL
jgi:hypothetical protein